MKPSSTPAKTPAAAPALSALRRCQPKPSPLYDVLWRFAAERHAIYLRRLSGAPAPWTADAVLSQYRFTNVFRASDRVSQYLIGIVESAATATPADLLVRVFTFKIFNRISTWERLTERVGEVRASDFSESRYVAALRSLRSEGTPLYSAAYIVPPVPGSTDKACGHMRLLAGALSRHLGDEIVNAPSLRDVFALLHELPGIGPFLAFQFAIDLNYSPWLSHSEMDFVVAGPGAIDGLSKCFTSLGDYNYADAIRWMTDRQGVECDRLGLDFGGLWGRPLQLIDVQNLLCEVSKYTRVTHPAVRGVAGRTRIKQRFTALGQLGAPRFPARWNLESSVQRWLLGASRPQEVMPRANAFRGAV